MAKLIGHITYPKQEGFSIAYAKLFSENDTSLLEFCLVNNGKKTVNAYRVELTYTAGGAEKREVIQGRNLELASGSATDKITCALSGAVEEGSITLSAVIYDDLSHNETAQAYPFASFDIISRKAESMLSGSAPMTNANAESVSAPSVAATPTAPAVKEEKAEETITEPTPKQSAAPLILALCALVGVFLTTALQMFLNAYLNGMAFVGLLGDAPVAVNLMFFPFYITCAVLALTAILLTKKNKRHRVAVIICSALALICNLFLFTVFGVMIFLVITLPLATVFLILALVKKNTALLVTTLSMLLVICLVFFSVGGGMFSCANEEKPDDATGYLVLGYDNEGSTRTVMRSATTNDLTLAESNASYIPYVNGYIDLVIPAYTPDGYSVIGISSSVFAENTAIRSLTTPQSVTFIYSAAFDDCTNLKTATLPGVQFIDMYAFYDCTALETITLSSSLQTIGDCAFAHCDSLQKIIFEGSAEEWNQIDIAPENDILYQVEIVFLG